MKEFIQLKLYQLKQSIQNDKEAVESNEQTISFLESDIKSMVKDNEFINQVLENDLYPKRDTI